MELNAAVQIRSAGLADVTAILEIYAPFVRETAITFEYEVPELHVFEARFQAVAAQYPWLVAVSGTKVLGYAYAMRFRERAAYQWCCECSVYVHPDFRRQGIARSLYESLFQELRQRGIINVYAVITLPNPQSVALHEHLGFETAGVLRKSGYKHGDWHDVLLMELFLAKHLPNPLMPDLNRT
jgi:L-amino acid N-acyltransferase YncA